MIKSETSYVDLPELAETFADSVRFIGFDGQTWRIEFSTTRIQPDLLKPDMVGIPAKQYPACRLVLTMAAGLDLLTKLEQTAKSLEQQGVIKRNEPAAKGFVMPEDKGPH